jgi:hypothetical protein
MALAKRWHIFKNLLARQTFCRHESSMNSCWRLCPSHPLGAQDWVPHFVLLVINARDNTDKPNFRLKGRLSSTLHLTIKLPACTEHRPTYKYCVPKLWLLIRRIIVNTQCRTGQNFRWYSSQNTVTTGTSMVIIIIIISLAGCEKSAGLTDQPISLFLFLLLLFLITFMQSIYTRVFTLIFLRQTVSLGITVLQLFCSYCSWCI